MRKIGRARKDSLLSPETRYPGPDTLYCHDQKVRQKHRDPAGRDGGVLHGRQKGRRHGPRHGPAQGRPQDLHLRAPHPQPPDGGASAKRGIIPLKDLDGIEEGTTVIIRAHGISPQERDTLKKKGVMIVDATCPKVGRVQSVIKNTPPRTTASSSWATPSIPR